MIDYKPFRDYFRTLLTTASELPVDGYVEMVSVKTSDLSVTVQHDGGGSTGICYVVDSGTIVYTAVAADTNLVLTIPHNSGTAETIKIWPATGTGSGRVGNMTTVDCNTNDITSLLATGINLSNATDCTDNELDEAALIAFVNSLATTTTGTVDYTGNPGTDDFADWLVTGDDKGYTWTPPATPSPTTITSITYNGVDEFADAATPFNQFAAGTRYATISMYFWLDSTRQADNNVLFWQSVAGIIPWIYFRVDTSNQIDVNAKGAAGDTTGQVNDQGSAVEDAWNTIIVQVDSASDTVNIWLNGSKVTDEVSLSVAISPFDNSTVPTTQRFGGTNGSTLPFKGRTRMMGIAGGNVAMTDDMAAEYVSDPAAHLAGTGTYPFDYAAWWYADDDYGTTDVVNGEGTDSRDLVVESTQWMTETP